MLRFCNGDFGLSGTPLWDRPSFFVACLQPRSGALGRLPATADTLENTERARLANPSFSYIFMIAGQAESGQPEGRPTRTADHINTIEKTAKILVPGVDRRQKTIVCPTTIHRLKSVVRACDEAMSRYGG
jgi:hypothetical protein